jgi:hypothetical protein
MHDLIDRIMLLSASDRKILHEALDSHLGGKGFRHAASMSIFSESYTLFTEKECSLERYPGPVTYLNRSIMGMSPIFVDSEWKIVFSSNSALTRPENFMPTIDHFLSRVAALRHSKAPQSDSLANVLSIQSWYPSYGHIHDEFSTLSHFVDTQKDRPTILIDYHIASDFHGRLDPVANAIEMHYMMLGESAKNAYIRSQAPIAIDSILIIRNAAQDKVFHSFPVPVAERLIFHANQSVTASYSQFQGADLPLYLGRRGGARSHRLISNSDEIENLLSKSGYHIAYPEDYGFKEIVYLISKAPEIILTWGSALTNLAYAKRGARVIVLKSVSYSSESLRLFEKIIISRSLDLSVLETANDNTVELGLLEELMKR